MSKYNNSMILVELYDLIDDVFSARLTNTDKDFSVDEIKMKNKNGYIMSLDINQIDDFAQRSGITRKDIMISIVEEYKRINSDFKNSKKKKTNKKLLDMGIKVKFLKTDIINGRYEVSISKDGEETISGILVVYSRDNLINVNFPFSNSEFPWTSVEKKLANRVIVKTVMQVFEPAVRQDDKKSVNDEEEKHVEVTINYYNEQPELGLCQAEILIGDGYFVKDIRVVYTVNGDANVAIESAVEEWECKDMTIKQARKMIIDDFKIHAVENNYQNYRNQKKDATKNELGRILNAENSSFKYYPNTLIRSKPSKKGICGKWGTLISEMANPKNPLISSFELDVLSWINTLRYMTKPMILDLYISGYITNSWRNINSDSLGRIVALLEKYLLIVRNCFVSFGNDVSDVESSCPFEIYTFGRNGARLLREIGRPAKYNIFDTVQDGNVVKCYLAANQWLIFMLKKYNKIIDNNYIANKKIYLLSSDSSGARVYGGVNLGNKYIIAEPWRRVDPVIKENDENEMLNKLWRFIKIFNDLNNVYTNDWSKMDFPSRPIICLLCEDYTHIKELIPVVNRVIKDNPQQRIWFTTDLNIFNEVVEGSRFFELSGDDLIDIDI